MLEMNSHMRGVRIYARPATPRRTRGPFGAREVRSQESEVRIAFVYAFKSRLTSSRLYIRDSVFP